MLCTCWLIGRAGQQISGSRSGQWYTKRVQGRGGDIPAPWPRTNYFAIRADKIQSISDLSYDQWMTMFEPTVHVIRKTLHTHKGRLTPRDPCSMLTSIFFHLFVFLLTHTADFWHKGYELDSHKNLILFFKSETCDSKFIDKVSPLQKELYSCLHGLLSLFWLLEKECVIYTIYM